MPTMTRRITRRIASLRHLSQSLAFTFIGVVFISLGFSYLLTWIYRTVPLPDFVYYMTLQFLPSLTRGVLLIVLGLAILAAGIWKLSGVVVFRFREQEITSDNVVLGYRRDRPVNIAVISGGAGMLILASLSEHSKQMTCITPPQDPIEYYYRASSMFQAPNVHYVVPTPMTPRVLAELDDGSVVNVMHIDHAPELAGRHVANLFLTRNTGDTPYGTMREAEAGNGGTARLVQQPATGDFPLTRPARDALLNADAIILGPGSLFESIVPNLLIDELRDAVQQSKARKIYICNLMTEPGLTTGFSVSDHIRQIKHLGGFTPDCTLVNVQRIESEVQTVYAAAHQAPVYLTPEEYEETVVPASESVAQRQLVIEGSVVIEADLASSVVRYNASLKNPDEKWAVRVLRHDPEKLTTALLELLRRR